MGSSKTTSTTDQTQKATATPEEQAMEKMQLAQYQATQPLQQQAQMSGLNLVNQLLTGTSPLPGFFGSMANGISSDTIGTQAAQMGKAAMPGFQSVGVLDSGEAQKSISKQIANELLFPAAQFNIGSLQNMLNLALSGQAQVQAPVMAGTSQLSSQLAGLRSMNTTGYSSNTYTPSMMSQMQQGMNLMGQLSSGIGGFGTGAGFTGGSWGGLAGIGG